MGIGVVLGVTAGVGVGVNPGVAVGVAVRGGGPGFPCRPAVRGPGETGLRLPIERDGASILKVAGSEVFAAYMPGPKGPVFMALLERNFGGDITTRSLDTVRKCAWA